MALTTPRDLDTLRAGIERWRGRPVTTLAHPSPGYSCETVIVDNETVLRLPPNGDGIFPHYDLAQQAAVQEAAGAAGVPVATPCTVETDPSFLGAAFVAMPFIAGQIPADFLPGDEWLCTLPSDAQRAAVWEAMIDVLVAIHRTPVPAGCGLRVGLETELDWWERYTAWATDGSPPNALEEVLAWCRGHRPAHEPPAGLLWGDVRFGNIIFSAETRQVLAVLDWDMTSVGPFELDLGWYLALEAVQLQFAERLGGFGGRADAIARCESSLGRRMHDLEWYEVFALARAATIATRISLLQQRAGQRPMFAPGHDPVLAAAQRRMANGQI